MKETSFFQNDLFANDFLNPIDQIRLKQVADDEGVACIFSSIEKNGLYAKQICWKSQPENQKPFQPMQR